MLIGVRPNPVWLSLTLFGALGACGTHTGLPDDGLDAQGVPSGPVTYTSHVQPLIEQNCVTCHTEGGIAPMSLQTFDQVKVWAEQIKRQVVSRAMPPWTAGPDCNEYLGDRSLSDAQIETISRWVDEGAEVGEGTPAKALELKRRTDEKAFRVDVELGMQEDYVPERRPDDYRCFLLEWKESEPAFVTGMGLTPGNRKIVHHTVVNLVSPRNKQSYLDKDAADPGPGYECFTTGISGGERVIESEGVNSAGTQLLGAFEKAEAGEAYPYGTGIRVEPGSLIVMQQHYNSLGAGELAPDRSTLQFMVEADVPNPGRASWLVNPAWENQQTRDTMYIPAGAPDTMVSTAMPGTFVGGSANFDLYWADLHMHTLGSQGKLEVIRADGSRECLLRVDDWKFEWQSTYFLKNPVSIGAGDQLYVECHWDNTAENQYIVDGERLKPQDVWWGDGSRDEMCLGNFLVVGR